MHHRVDGRSWTRAYCISNMRISEWRKLALHHTNTVVDVPNLRNREERDFVMMLDKNSSQFR